MELAAEMISLPNGVKPKNKETAWMVTFSSKKVADFLRGLGLTPAKSHTIIWPDIPESYYPSFVRGVLDGNGSVCTRFNRVGQKVPDLTVSIYGASPFFRLGLEGWLKKNSLKFSSGITHHTVWRVMVGEHASLRTLYEMLYPSTDVPCLERKRIPFKKWMVTPRQNPGPAARGLSMAKAI